MNPNDERIKKDVVDEFYWDDRIDASNINVTVNDGIVTLTGEVPSYSTLSLAKSAAWGISGVLNVIDELTVKYATPPALPTDAELKARVVNILTWDPDIDETAIVVSVKDLILTLEGTVDAYWKKFLAESKVYGLHGVLGIVNKLAVVPTHRITDENIARDIVSSLDRDILVDAEEVTVEVDDGIVALMGKVPSWASKRAAELDATVTAGVIDVNNKLSVAA